MQLSDTLFRAMSLAFVTSTLQVLVGFIPFNVAAIICIGSAIVTFGFVMFSLWLIRANLQYWQKTFQEPELPMDEQ